MPRLSLPIVDMSEDRVAVAGALREAATASGFFYLVNHGVPAGLLDDMMRQARCLFGQDLGAKLAIEADRPSGLGYGIMGPRTSDDGPGPNAKEEFYYSRDNVPGLNEANRWPEGLPGFRDTLATYSEELHALAGRTMGLLAESIGLAPSHFEAFCADPIATIRLVRYPAEGAKAGAHTDFGALTFLLQDESGGLQVFDKAADQWIDATPVPGSFVVNLGDLFEIWTNRTYCSSLHRVVHTTGRDRYSIPFFLNGAADYVVECLPQFLKAGERPALPPTTPSKRLDAGYVTQGIRDKVSVP